MASRKMKGFQYPIGRDWQNISRFARKGQSTQQEALMLAKLSQQR